MNGAIFPRERNFHMSDMNLFYTHRDFYQAARTSISLEEAIEYGLIWDLNAVHWGLPEATVGYASNRPVFLLSGPGVRQNARGDLSHFRIAINVAVTAQSGL